MRELRNQIERAVLLTKGATIHVNALQVGCIGSRAATPVAGTSTSSAVGGPESTSSASPSADRASGGDYLAGLGHEILGRVTVQRSEESSTDVLTQVEKAIVSAALERSRGNKQAASHLLGVYRPRLYHMIKKHELAEGS